jgi:peptide/nickel transport system permease protein/oligopeptide transport system permease protein
MPDTHTAAPASPSLEGWRRLRRNRAAVVSLWFLAFVVLASALGPFLIPAEKKRPSDTAFGRPGQSASLTIVDPADPTKAIGTRQVTFWLGSDDHGKDVLYRVLAGARVSLVVGLAAAAVNLLIGVAYGLTAGFFGGRVDALMMRAVDLLYALPRILIIMVLISAYSDGLVNALDAGRLWAQSHGWSWLEQSFGLLLPYNRMLVVILSLGLIEWLTMARIVRGQVLVLREAQFVTAARAMGQRAWKIMARHLLPNLWTVILTYLTLTIPAVILTESFLSFLGLGIDEPAASWGSLLKQGAQVINPLESRWWLLVFPAAALSTTLLALNFLGDGLRDAFDPRSKD